MHLSLGEETLHDEAHASRKVVPAGPFFSEWIGWRVKAREPGKMSSYLSSPRMVCLEDYLAFGC